MTDTKQPEALRLAEQYDYGDPAAHSNTWKAAVCNELRRLHAENTTLQQGYDAARLEIEARNKQLVKESARTAEEKLRADRMTEQHRMQCQMREGLEREIDNLKLQLAQRGGVKWQCGPQATAFGGCPECGSKQCVARSCAMHAQADSQPALPKISAEDRSLLHYNPNTDDIVEWVQHYASAAIAADRAMRAQTAPAARNAAERDALLQAAIDFIRTLTGMTPPPIEVAPPEVFAPFRAFVDRVQAITREYSLPAPVAQGDALDVEIAALESSCAHLGRLIDELRPDAERYQYLRERDLDTIRQGGVFAGRTPDNVVLNGDDLDAAIDAARAQAKEGQSHG